MDWKALRRDVALAALAAFAAAIAASEGAISKALLIAAAYSAIRAAAGAAYSLIQAKRQAD